jgi:predicted transcriptional regulator
MPPAWGHMAETVHIRLNAATRAHLEALAEARSTSLSGAVREAIVQATFPERDVPDEDELLRLLGVAARSGSVPACRELLRYYRQDRKPQRPSALGGIDELARRRMAGGGAR